MYRRLLILLAVVSTVLPLAALAQTSANVLPPQAVTKVQEAQELIRRERFVDAMSKLDEAETVAPNNPQIFNLRGTIYLSRPLRDFGLAKEFFDKAEALMPGTLVVAFNQAEVLYVKNDWPAARAAYDKLLQAFPKIPEATRHLILFKRLVTESRGGDMPAAEKTLKENFTFMDDTPAYYYANAAIAFQAGDEAKAKDWIKRADGIYKAEELAPYIDSLTEARWIPDISLPLQEK